LATGQMGIETLSERQREILRLLSQNMQTKEIARALDISDHTVKTHLETIRKRLGVATSREAGRLYLQYEGSISIPQDGGAPIKPIDDSPLKPLNSDQSLGGLGAGDATGRHFGESVPETNHIDKAKPPESLTFWYRLELKLKAYGPMQWLGLIVLMSIGSALIFGGLMMAILSTLESIERLKDHFS
jgi:DNA-binding CsgD family transcriptional regulator